MYFFNISTIIGVSSFILFLVYLAFEPWITHVRWIGRHAQTHPVLELDGTIEFNHEIPEYSRIIPNPQIQF